MVREGSPLCPFRTESCEDDILVIWKVFDNETNLKKEKAEKWKDRMQLTFFSTPGLFCLKLGPNICSSLS